ncbi:AsmA family protein [Pontibacter sp. JAM-7]|uniref:AsmA family protein n=1 Tax=Pontibacter sp. JAM-7 TaxID=3366581 RepID=UPI003AF7988D
MKVLLKIVAGFAALVLILVVAGGAILGAFFDPNEYKPEIEQAALDKGGVELKINGDIGWSVFPWLGLEVNQIDVKYPSKPQLASLQQAQVSVKLLALFSGKVEMKSVLIDGLNLALVQNKDGSNNWSASSSATQAKTKPDAAESAGGGALALDIESIEVKQGRISYQDLTSGMEALITELNLTSGQVVTGAFFPLELGFTLEQKLQGESQVKVVSQLKTEILLDLEQQLYQLQGLDSALTLSGKPLAGNSLSFSTQADVKADLAKQQAEVSNLTLALANLTANGNLKVADFDNPVISGNLNLAEFDLNKLLAALGQTKVETTDSDVLKKISLQAELGGAANTVNAKSLTLKLDDTTFTGNAGFNLGTSAISLNLKGDSLDADRYLPPATDSKPASKPVAGVPETYSKEPVIPVEALKPLNLDSTLALGTLKVSGLDISNIDLAVNARGGVINASKLNADMYKGQLRNSVQLDLRNAKPSLRVRKNISGIDMGSMLIALAQVDQLTGTLNAQADITTRGNSVYDFVNTATGSSSIKLSDGEIKGIDAAQSVCQAMNNVSSLGINSQEVDRSTPFANISATLPITNGVINSQDLTAQLDAMALNGRGLVNLPKQTLDYRLGFKVEKNLFKETCSFPNALENVEIPINCKGGFATPPQKMCKPDLSVITDALKARVKEKAKAKVEEKLNKELENKLGDKLKGLLGR